MSPAKSTERGAALLTVLMIVAAMSVAALAITTTVTNATQRARALDAQAQLALYAVAAEEVAKARMADILGPLENRLHSDLPGYGEPQIIPVNEGVFRVVARDMTNCFDVNRLTKPSGEGDLIADRDVQAAYQEVLSATIEEGYASDMVGLVSSLTDWMDENSVPGSGGAEDSYYLSESPSYRTSNQKLASLNELRSVRGYSVDVLSRVLPVICALPERADAANRKLNINTLEEHHAPLLRAVFTDALTIEDARTLILTRPQGGWSDTQALMDDPIVQRIDPARVRSEDLGLVSSLIEVSANVSYRGYDMTMRYLFEAVPGRPIRTLRRERVG